MDKRPKAGHAEVLAPGIRRVLAPNPSAMTHWGTNTYLIGYDELAVIDPGPNHPDHLVALQRAIGTGRVRYILVTHAHRDHSMLAPRLSQDTGAPVLAFGAPDAGRSPMMEQLARSRRAGGGEGVDGDFQPDQTLRDGQMITVGAYQIEAVHTPGHFPGHLSFALDEILLSGDHVMGWSTTLISPPEGEVAAFLASCKKLLRRSYTTYLPGHGAPVQNPQRLVSYLIQHRSDREEQILTALMQGPATPGALAERIYEDIPAEMLPVAARNVLAHLIDLAERSIVAPDAEIAWDARFFRL